MTVRTMIEIAVSVLVLLAIGSIARTWLAEHDARLKAEASIAAAQKSFDQASAEMKHLQDADQARDTATAATIAKISEAAAAQKTPQQITNWIPEQLGSLPAPIKSSIAPTTAENPSPSATFVVPAPDLGPLKDLISQGQECAVKLPSAESDLTSCQAQAKLARQQIEDLTTERNALNEELKGGTLWHRIRSGAKKVAIGAAVAAAAVCASGHCK